MKVLSEVELWAVDLAACRDALLDVERRVPRLSAADRERAASITDAEVRDEWQAAHVALRVIIEHACGDALRGVALAREERGKPFIEGAPISFSLSHAPGLALVGISPDGDIGVDVECERVVRIGAERRARICAAGAGLTTAPLARDSGDGFLQAWVRLEAFAKADGCGIGRVLSRLGIVGAGGREPVEAEIMLARAASIVAEAPRTDVRDLQLGRGRFAAVACRGVAAMAACAVPVRWLASDVKQLEQAMF